MEPKRSLYVPYYQYLKFTKWLIQQRDSLPETNQLNLPSKNICILINCCIIIEGLLYTLIKDHIHIATHQLNEELKIEKIKDPILYVKMLEEFSNKLDKDQWEGYLNLFELFSSKKINKNTNLYKTINILFQFRGFLVHGCELEILVNDSKNGKYTLSSENRKLKPILAYCVENKLEFVDFELKRVNILSNKLTNHFYDAMLKFSIELYDLLPDSMKAYTKIDMFEFNN